jgi:hypothetical protein
MKMTFASCVLVALALWIATAPAADGKLGAGAPEGGELAALERKLLGTWQGGPCVGDYTFNADGTFELRHFTPGGNTLTGTWSLRWDALPPTLVLTCRTSDFRKKDPGRAEYAHLGKALELKVLQLDGDALVLRFSSDKKERRYERPAGK